MITDSARFGWKFALEFSSTKSNSDPATPPPAHIYGTLPRTIPVPVLFSCLLISVVPFQKVAGRWQNQEPVHVVLPWLRQVW